MRISLLTYGSRGDVQPFLALAVGLQDAGHSVQLAAPGRFSDLVGSYGIPFIPLSGDPAEISRGFNEAGRNVYRMVKAMQEHVIAIAPRVVQEIKAASQWADLLVHSFLFTTGGHTFARQLGIPDVSVQTFPIFAPTRAFPNVAFARVPPGPLSRFTHWLAAQVFWYGGNSGYARLRRKHPQDFPKRLYWPFRLYPGRPLTPLLFAYSPVVLPRPADWTAPNIHLTGYFFLEGRDYHPASALRDFLASGEAPVCVSFGSMVNRQAERIDRTVREALVRTGQRGILLTGWGGWKPEDVGPNLLYLDSAPHDWLFPRCKVVIHHGGVGTTAAGLRAGVPNIVVPFAADQPFWGRRVAEIGAGPEPIPVKRLDVTSLTAALNQALYSESMQRAASEIGMKIRREDGVGAAVKLVENWSSEFWRDRKKRGNRLV